MFKKSIKNCIAFIVTSVVVSAVLFAVVCLLGRTRDVTKLVGVSFVIWFVAFWVVVYFVFDLIRTKRWNKYLDELPYEFNYNLEFEIYNLTGRKARGRKAKEILKHKIVIPRKYSEWKKHIEDDFEKLSTIDDFYRFLRHTRRKQELYYDGITMVSVPLEIAMVTSMIASIKNEMDILFTISVMILFVAMIIVKEMKFARGQLHFIDDVIEILFPDKITAEGK